MRYSSLSSNNYPVFSSSYVTKKILELLDYNDELLDNVQRIRCTLTDSVEYRVRIDMRVYMIGTYEVVETGQYVNCAWQFFPGSTKCRELTKVQLVQLYGTLKEQLLELSMPKEQVI